MVQRSRQQPVPISPRSLAEGYALAIDNALRFFDAACELLRKFPDKALALAQLGQEELGKSLTLLAAFALPQDPVAWAWFWEGWRGLSDDRRARGPGAKLALRERPLHHRREGCQYTLAVGLSQRHQPRAC